MRSASLVMSRKRFESARRLSILPANPVKTESLRPKHRGLCQQYVSSRLLSQGFVLRVGVPQMVAGHRAGGVGGSSGMDHLTDVPKFRRVRRRRKCSARVPSRWILLTSS
jgi:hypothetical protein